MTQPIGGLAGGAIGGAGSSGGDGGGAGGPAGGAAGGKGGGVDGGMEGGNEGGNTSERTEQHGGSAQPKSASDPEEASPLSASKHNILREQEGAAKAAASKEEL